MRQQQATEFYACCTNCHVTDACFAASLVRTIHSPFARVTEVTPAKAASYKLNTNNSDESRFK